jgi:phage terminase large subunit
VARILRGAVTELFRRTDPEILVEGRAGTGKSIGILTYLHDRARRYPGCRILICRQTRESCTDSVMVTWEEKVLTPQHPLIANGPARQNRHSYVYPNRSEIVIGGLDKPAKLFSTEWDFVYANEATEISLEAWELFGRAMRNNKAPYQQRIADCNPGPPAHWLNRRAFACDDVLRAVESADDYRRLQAYNRGAQGGPMRRMVSVHQDNPAYFELRSWRWTPGGQKYLAMLDAMTGHRKQRMKHGLWVAGEGTVYPEFNDAKHVCRPFAIPEEWPVFVGWDPGYDHPTAILWVAVAPNGTYYVFDEIYQGGRGVKEHCENIRTRNAGRTVRRYLGDPQHCFSSTAQSPESIATQARKHGVKLTPWPRSTDVEAMVNKVRERLTDVRIKVFATCTNTIDEFQSWRYKRTAKGELPTGDDAFEDANNHAMDVIKGLVAARLGELGGRVRVVGGE